MLGRAFSLIGIAVAALYAAPPEITDEALKIRAVDAVRFLDGNTLMVESDLGGAGSAAVALKMFDLGEGRLNEVLSTNSLVEYDVPNDPKNPSIHFTQKLDLPRALKAHGKEFCFAMAVTMERDKWIVPPRVTYPCYKRGEGVDQEESRKRNERLRPVTSPR